MSELTVTVTRADIYAARGQVALDRLEGRETPQWTVRLAETELPRPSTVENRSAPHDVDDTGIGYPVRQIVVEPLPENVPPREPPFVTRQRQRESWRHVVERMQLFLSDDILTAGSRSVEAHTRERLARLTQEDVDELPESVYRFLTAVDWKPWLLNALAAGDPEASLRLSSTLAIRDLLADWLAEHETSPPSP